MGGIVAIAALIIAVGSVMYARNIAPDDAGGTKLTKQGTLSGRDRVYGTCLVSCTNVYTNVLNRDRSFRVDTFSVAGIGPLIFHNVWIDDKKMFEVDKNDLTVATSAISGKYSDSQMREPYQQSKELVMHWRSGQENQVAADTMVNNSDGEVKTSAKGALVPNITIYADATLDQDFVIFGDRYNIIVKVTAVDIYDVRTGLYDGASSNPSLAIYDFLTSDYFGMGITEDYIDLESFKHVANRCEFLGLEINAQIDANEAFSETLQKMLSTFGGALVIHQGKIKILFEDLELTSVYSFDFDNILEGTFSVRPDSSGNYYNVVSASYKSEINSENSSDYVIPADATDRLSMTHEFHPTRIFIDGEIITKSIELPYSVDAYESDLGEVSRGVKLLTNREYKRAEFQKTCSFDIDLLDYPLLGIWSVVEVTHPIYGWVKKKMRVQSMNQSVASETGGFNIATINLSEYDDSIYTETLEGAPSSKLPTTAEIKPPLNLNFDLKTYVTNGYGILTWTPQHFTHSTGYDIEYKLQSEPNWTRIASHHTQNKYHVYNLKKDTYDFRIRTNDNILGTSIWSTIESHIVGIDYTLPLIENLTVDASTSSFSLNWDDAMSYPINNSVSADDPNGGGSNGVVRDVFGYYLITVIKNNVAQSTHKVTDPFFVYTLPENQASPSGVNRSVTFTVQIFDINDVSGDGVDVLGVNPQITAPTNFVANNKLQISNLTWDVRTEPDFAATQIHISGTTGFTPNASSLYKTTVNDSYLYQFPEGVGDKYARIGHYDEFGTDSITFSPEILLAYVPITVGYDDAELRLEIEELSGDIGQLETDLNNKFPITETDISDGAISSPKILANSIISEKISAGAITTRELSTNVVRAENLYVGAISGVNNFSTSGKNDGWSGNYPLVDEVMLYGSTVKTMKVTTSGDVQVLSDAFAIDHDEVYEVSLSIYSDAPDDTGTRYFGVYAYDDDIYNISGASTTSVMDSYNPTTLTIGNPASNAYFWLGDVSNGSWRIMKAYIIGANVDINTIPQASNVTTLWKLRPEQKSCKIRFLNHYNNGTSVTNHFFNPSVKRVGAGFIRSENIKAGIIEGHSIKSNSLIESPKIYVGDVANSQGKTVVLDSLASSPIVVKNNNDTMLNFVTVNAGQTSEKTVLQLGGGLAANTIDSADVFTKNIWDLIAPPVQGSTGGVYEHTSLPYMVTPSGTTSLPVLEIPAGNSNDVEISFKFHYQLNQSSSTTNPSPIYNFTVKRSINDGGLVDVYNKDHTGEVWIDNESNYRTYDLTVNVNVTDVGHNAADNDTIQYFLIVRYVSGYNSTNGFSVITQRVTSFTVGQIKSGGGLEGLASAATFPYVSLDTSGSSTYPRFNPINNPASDDNYLRAPSAGGGFLPFSNGSSYMGTNSWRWAQIHGVNFYENGTALTSKYLGLSATAAKASTVTINADNTSNSIYEVVWHSGNSLYSSVQPVTINPAVGQIAAKSFAGNANVGGTGAAIYCPSGIYSQGTNWLYGAIITNNNSINAGSGTVTAATFSGNATTATKASTVNINSGNTSGIWYDVAWHSGVNLYSSVGVEIQGSTNSIRAGRFYVGDATRGYFYTDATNRTAFAGGTLYIQSSVPTYYNYSPTQYHGNTTGTTHSFRGNLLNGNSWNISTSGVITGTDAGATSDIRVKYDICNIEDASNKRMSIRGCTFGRYDMDNQQHAGVIAQEVQKILPEAIIFTDSDDPLITDKQKLNVSMSAMIGLLVESANEDRIVINKQEIEIDNLKTEIDNLKSKMETIIEMVKING